MVARRAHNPKVVGSNPAPATNQTALAVIFLPILSIFLYWFETLSFMAAQFGCVGWGITLSKSGQYIG